MKQNKHIITCGNGDPDDMLALVSGRVLRETKKKLTPGGYLKLKDGHRYGYLALVMGDRRGANYRCECDCGGVVYLSRYEIQERQRLKVGCLDFDCPHGPEEVKAWRDPTYSLWLQLCVLLRDQPENVDNRWGGRAYEGVAREDKDAGFANLMSDAGPLISRPIGRWWISRGNPVLPYAGFNLRLTTKPEVNLFGSRSRYVVYNDQLYSVNNLATLFDLPLRSIMKWKRETVGDEGLMEKILRETKVE